MVARMREAVQCELESMLVVHANRAQQTGRVQKRQHEALRMHTSLCIAANCYGVALRCACCRMLATGLMDAGGMFAGWKRMLVVVIVR
jgi:hypothetical protein